VQIKNLLKAVNRINTCKNDNIEIQQIKESKQDIHSCENVQLYPLLNINKQAVRYQFREHVRRDGSH